MPVMIDHTGSAATCSAGRSAVSARTRTVPGMLFMVFVLAAIRAPTLIAASPPEDPEALLKEFMEASSHTRPLARRKLMLLGARGLSTMRAAREREKDPELKIALARIATAQLALKITPALRERHETGLHFDGQYDNLKEEGPEVATALLFLINDEAILTGDEITHWDVRLASCQALADVGDETVLPVLRTMYNDSLFFPPLEERIGILMAIFGDTYGVEQEISRLEELVAQSEAADRSSLPRNERLANLYYEIRDYAKAVACYDRILLVFNQIYREARRGRLPTRFMKDLKNRFALHYYNAACSQTLNGDLEKARELLKKCVDLDASHFENHKKDGDFRKLRASDGYEEFLKELSKLLPRESL